MTRAPIAVVILTFNEELNLPEALDSVKDWASEVFVVDSFSTDRTVDIALERDRDGVRVVQHRFTNYSEQWNWTLDKLPFRTEWVLKLDADERVLPEFRAEVSSLLGDPANPHVAYAFRRSLVFLGGTLRWGDARSNWDVRLFKHRHSRFESRSVNEHLLARGGPIGRLRSVVAHDDAKDFAAWAEKQNRYSSLEALIRLRGEHSSTVPRLLGSRQERVNWLRDAYFRTPFHNILGFLLGYVLRLGFLDGRRGIHYAVLRAWIFYLVDVKLLEHRLTGRSPTVPALRRGAPHPRVAGSSIQDEVDGRADSNELAPGVLFS